MIGQVRRLAARSGMRELAAFADGSRRLCRGRQLPDRQSGIYARAKGTFSDKLIDGLRI